MEFVNPVYREEIDRELRDMDLAPEVLTVEDVA